MVGDKLGQVTRSRNPSDNVDTETEVTASSDAPGEEPPAPDTLALQARGLRVYYGAFQALRNVDLEVTAGKITSIIGPSGCGKSTLIRCFNRMNDSIPAFRAEGEVLFEGQNI